MVSDLLRFQIQTSNHRQNHDIGITARWNPEAQVWVCYLIEIVVSLYIRHYNPVLQ